MIHQLPRELKLVLRDDRHRRWWQDAKLILRGVCCEPPRDVGGDEPEELSVRTSRQRERLVWRLVRHPQQLARVQRAPRSKKRSEFIHVAEWADGAWIGDARIPYLHAAADGRGGVDSSLEDATSVLRVLHVVSTTPEEGERAWRGRRHKGTSGTGGIHVHAPRRLRVQPCSAVRAALVGNLALMNGKIANLPLVTVRERARLDQRDVALEGGRDGLLPLAVRHAYTVRHLKGHHIAVEAARRGELDLPDGSGKDAVYAQCARAPVAHVLVDRVRHICMAAQRTHRARFVIQPQQEQLEGAVE
mmetsp:Transcript_642/g.1444  ORF Transcript_642/g.1444 Transcript_642/m.1444 type:complete len:303 (-) Transcript_642:197-1105(-)